MFFVFLAFFVFIPVSPSIIREDRANAYISGASWNGAGVERAGAARRQEDPASPPFFVFRPEKPMGTEVSVAG